MRILLSYIDPGTGSFALQAALGAVMGGAYLVRTRLRFIIAKFKPKKDASKTSDNS